MLKRKKGFTLLELMIVVIIIGILASLAIPRFIVARDKAIKSEAENMLGAIRGSQMRYYLESPNNYYATGVGDLDVTVDPASKYFDYSAANDTAGSSYVGQAVGKIGTAMDGVTVSIEADGKITPP